MLRIFLLALVALLLAGKASADQPPIDRTIAKQPSYQTKRPGYALLVFGSQGRDRVWLVRDGSVLYVDRNGNGDLTEPGERTELPKQTGAKQDNGETFEVRDVTVGGRTHKDLSVIFAPLKDYTETVFGNRPEVKAALAKDPNTLLSMITMDVDMPGLKGGGIGGRVNFTAGPFDLNGVLQFADKPQDAPVIHFGGPLQVTFYSERPVLRVGRTTEFVLVVGTAGVGPGTFGMVSYHGTVPEAVKPIAELTLPGAKPNQPEIRDRIEIRERC